MTLKLLIKSLLRPFFRLYLCIRYNIPIICNYNKNHRYRTLIDVLCGVRSIAIVGRGSSIKECNPILEINNVEFIIIMNRVEIESLKEYIGKKIDAQIALPPRPYMVLPNESIKKYGVRYISSNKRQSSFEFKNFYCSYFNREAEILRYPDDNELDYNFTKYSAYAPTQCGSLMKIIFNIKSINKIVFAGVDFYTQGYLAVKDENIVAQAPRTSIYKKKGLPLIKYIKKYSKYVSKDRELKLYFPETLKNVIGDDENGVINYYECGKNKSEK